MCNFIVYILYSPKLDRYYTGTTDNLLRRLEEHENGTFSNSFTGKGRPWQLYLSIEGLESGQAYKIEKHIKRMASKKYKEDLKKYPDMVVRLCERYGSLVQPR